jgi:D-arabinose 1-dehydrogenase-like Zn-dependent alcohol dehydrogenase
MGAGQCGALAKSNYLTPSQDTTHTIIVSVPRKDGEEFFTLASKIPLKTSVRTFPLAEANAALDAVREGRLEGAAVLTVA